MNYRAAFACFFSLLCFAFAAGVVFRQGMDLGTIRGIVTDTTGAIIPGAGIRGRCTYEQHPGNQSHRIDNRRSVRLRLRITFYAKTQLD